MIARVGNKSNKKPIYWDLLIPALLISCVLLLPYLFLVAKPLFGNSDHWQHIQEFLLLQYIVDTVSILLAVGSLCLLWGVFPAYLISRFSFPGSRFFSWALVGPLAIPGFIMAIIYTGIMDITGPVSKLGTLINPDGRPFYIDILNFWGLAFTLSFALFPYVYLSSILAFRRQTQAYEEAALSLGQSSFQVFRKVSLPLAVPFILSGLLLVMMELLNNYGAMKYFGQNTLSVGIFKAWFDLNDLNSAIKLGGFLFLFVLLLLAAKNYRKQNAPNRSYRSIKLHPLKGWKRHLATLFCSLLFVFTFLLPASFIFYQGIRYWSKIIEISLFKVVLQTLSICLISSLVIIAVSLLFAESKRWLKLKWLNKLISINNSGYAIPGAIIAIGVIALAQIFHISSAWFYLSINVLIFGFAIRFLSSGFQVIQNGLDAQAKEQDESAQSMGYGKWTIFRMIHFPQLSFPVVVAFLFVFIEVIKELPLTLILKPFNFESLSTLSFQYAKDEMLNYACVPAMIILLITIIPNFLIHRYLQR